MNSNLKLAKQLRIYVIYTDEYIFNNVHWKDDLVYLLKNGVTSVQLRLKTCDKETFLKYAIIFQKICHKYKKLFIVNDFYDIALKSNANGVHVGQKDLNVEVIRKNAPHLIIGLSTANKAHYEIALKVKPDYIGIGAFHPTKTKKDATIFQDYQIFEKNIPFPYVFIGGLNHQNIPPLLKYHPTGFAFVSFLCKNVKNVQLLNF